jgi:ATP-dependent helicase/nuclease subunit A
MERITADQAWPIMPPSAALVAGWLGCTPPQAALACAQATCILSQPQLQRFFDPSQFVSADNELELLVEGAVLRIDRVVRFADAIWILDYKRNADEQDSAGYRRQLEGYRRALQSVSGPLPVYTALITVDGRFWPFAPPGAADETRTGPGVTAG